MNKKFLTGALCALLVGGLLTTGTFAYFTDKDHETNSFAIGDVTIDLTENFDTVAATDMVPGRKVNKDVFVTNTSFDNDAYVRIHMAIPKSIDDGDPNFNASRNFLHWNFTGASVAEGQWSWGTQAVAGTNTSMPGYPGNGGAWNFYETEIDGKEYNVYVATYTKALAAKAKTETESLTGVYLDTTVDTVVREENGKEVTYYVDTNGNEVLASEIQNFNIKVVAEGVQAEGFADAFTALNTAFGVPSATNNPFN